MKTIGLLPLDSRPCNTQWLIQLAKIAGYQLLMYDRNKCGNLHTGANYEEEIEWIKSVALQLDYLIVSCDALYFGGLVQARTGQTDLQKISIDKMIFHDLKIMNPKLKIYLFDTLMRTSISSINKETEKYWKYVNEYSKLVGLVHFFNRDSDKQELEKITKKIPVAIINEYLKARKTKNYLNKMVIEYALSNDIDYLILLQEDSMPYGLQQIEAQELKLMIGNNPKISFYNGTDEGGAILLAKAINDDLKLNSNIYLYLPFAKCLDKTMLFEDRSCIENLQKMFMSIGLSFGLSPHDSDFVLAVYAEKENVDLDLNSIKEITPKKNNIYFDFIEEVNKLSKKNNLCLVDLLFPNGGSIDLLHDIDTSLLKCYSAWNTASNSLGSAICNIVCYLAGEKNKINNFKSLNNDFLYERIIDDCFYQYLVRRQINVKYYNTINIFDFKDDDVLSEIEKKINFEIERFFNKEIKFIISLPWNRTFECEIKCN